jgi:tripartite-type tricarboxylate transporter receptor subunit TctC
MCRIASCPASRATDPRPRSARPGGTQRLAPRHRRWALARLFALLACAIVALLPAPLRAAFPDRTVTIVVPFAPGNAADVMARLLAPKLAAAWGQAVVVQNQPGASGAIGVERVVRSPPDGHTLAMTGDAAIVTRVGMTPPLPYDPRRDLAPVTLLARTPNLLVVRPEGPKTLGEFVAMAKAAQGRLNYPHAGPGTSVQVAAEMLKQMAGFEATGVGYPGMLQLVQDLLAGRADFAFVTAVAVAGQVREGRLRALGVSSPERLAAFPDVPSIAEQGYPGFDTSAFFGLVAPAGTPAAVTARIQADVVAALADAEIRARLDGLGAILIGNTPEAFAALIAADIPRLGAVLRRAGITGE